MSDNQLSFSGISGVGSECECSGSKSFKSFEVLIGTETKLGFFYTEGYNHTIRTIKRLPNYALLQAAESHWGHSKLDGVLLEEYSLPQLDHYSFVKF